MSPMVPARLRKITTYTAGSVIAAGCSQLAFALCYGLAGLSPQLSTVLAWLAGAVPNYWLNRAWTWQQRGRPSLRREVLPYAGIVLVTLALAMLATHVVDRLLAGSDAAVRTVLVTATFLGVYVLMFLLRFLMLDRLFSARVSA